MAVAVTMAFVLGVHVFARPFFHETNNRLETYALFCAFGVSVLNIMLDKPAEFDVMTGVFAIAPMVPVDAHTMINTVCVCLRKGD